MLHTFSRRPRWWLAVVQVVLLLATIAMPAAAAPTMPPASSQQLIQLLKTFKLVKGDEQGNLNLDKPIKRSELATIMVRALGAEQESYLYAGLSSFTDIKGHWAAGPITYAATKGLLKGDGNGRVRPDDYVTYAEALTVIVRVVNKEPVTGDWPSNVLLAAFKLGILPAGISSANLNDTAVRGVIFESFASAISTVDFANGKTLLQTYVAKDLPTVSLNAVPSSVTTEAVTISGTYTSSSPVTVTVNGQAATVNGTSFVATTAVTWGSNRVVATVTDLAGNQASTNAVVVRSSPVASVDLAGPTKVKPGSTTTFIVTARDKDGKALSLNGVTATLDSALGSFDLTSGVFTASQTPAKGKLTFTAGQFSKSFDLEVMGLAPTANLLRIQTINGGASVAYTKPMTVVVEVDDALGTTTSDFTRPVVLSASGISGVTVQPPVAYTKDGLATFVVTAPTPGQVTLTATSSGLSTGSTIATFGTNLHVVLRATPPALTVGGATTQAQILAELRDQNGSLAANNTGSDIFVSLASSVSDGFLSNNSLVIRSGAVASSTAGLFNIGATAGVVTFTGAATGTPPMTVDPTSLTVVVPNVGSGSRLVVKDALNWAQLSNGSATATFYVRLEDANGSLIPASYAFQLRVDTSNGEPKTNGIPAGVAVSLGTTGLNPVNSGNTQTNGIIARTAGGTAVVQVTYDKPGKITLTPMAVGATTLAYSSDGLSGAANDASGLQMAAGTGQYRTTPAKLTLTVDSAALGTGQPIGLLSSAAGGSVTLRAQLSDSSDHWIPGLYDWTVALSRSGNSTVLPPNVNTTTADSKAGFVIGTSGIAGTDTYTVTATKGATTLTGTVSIVVQNQAPQTPSIVAIRGVNNNFPGRLAYVAPGDTGMEIEIAPPAGDSWLSYKVYDEYGTVVNTSGAIDVTLAAPKITVPKSALQGGSRRYYVVARNGYGFSNASPLTAYVTNALYTTDINVTSARYDFGQRKLYVFGNGFSTGDVIDTSLMSLVNPSSTVCGVGGCVASLSGARVQVNSYNQMTLDLSDVSLNGLAAMLADSTKFYGASVTVAAQAGWYQRANGYTATDDLTGNPATPFARINSVVYDPTNARLYVTGDGFSTGLLDFSKLKLTGATTDYTFSSLGASRTSDQLITVPLSSAVITALNQNNSYVVAGATGWISDGGLAYPGISNAAINIQVALYSVTNNAGNTTITITGSGLDQGTIDLLKLRIKDLSSSATLALTGATISTQTGTTVVITLTAGQQTTFSNSNVATGFSGSDIYLLGDAGWFTGPGVSGRTSTAIPSQTLRLPTR